MKYLGHTPSLAEGLLNALAAGILFFVQIAGAEPGIANKNSRRLPGWRTNTQKRIIALDELQSGGPGKNGIPSINKPKFVAADRARRWLKPVEPVISLSLNGRAKAYPLQILIWHEIVNDRIGETPVTVTFCPTGTLTELVVKSILSPAFREIGIIPTSTRFCVIICTR